MRFLASLVAAGTAHAGVAALVGSAARGPVQPSTTMMIIEASLEAPLVGRPNGCEQPPLAERPDEHAALGHHRAALPVPVARPPEQLRDDATATILATSLGSAHAEEPRAGVAIGPGHDGTNGAPPAGSPETDSLVLAEGPGSESGTPAAARLPVRPALGGIAIRSPRLLSDPNPCLGVFPRHAECDRGIVTVALDVTKSGAARAPRVLSERPAGQGFGGAARLCSMSLRFYPASDAAGRPVPGSSVVRLRFAR